MNKKEAPEVVRYADGFLGAIEHVLFECGRYEMFRRECKGVISHEKESVMDVVLG